MIYFSSDLHGHHSNIIKHCNRPFDSIEDMNDAMIQNINRVVKPNDTMYVIGDFVWWGGSDEQIANFCRKINCKNLHLVIGNHDEPILDKLKPHFVSGDYLKEIRHAQRTIVMCHYAMRTWNQSHRGSFHLYGHSHGQLPDDPHSYSFDVGVDCHNFKPLSIEEVFEIMEKKKWVNPLANQTDARKELASASKRIESIKSHKQTGFITFGEI